MLTIDEARRKGIEVCVKILGKDLVEKHKSTSTASWGVLPGAVRCFVGVDTRKRTNHLLVLDSTSKWSHCAECKVSLKTGEITGLRRRTESEDCLDTADAKNPVPGELL